MKEISYFKDSGLVTTFAALPGINKVDWKFINSTQSKEDAFQIMKRYAFDILPVKNKSGEFNSYYCTSNWGVYKSNEIELKEITKEDRLYYLSSIEDVIRKMVDIRTKYFFLDNHFEVIGLITIGNLNSKFVYRYVYNLILEFEHSLGDLIYSNNVEDLHIIDYFKNQYINRNTKDSLRRFENDNNRGFDNNFIEYVYLKDFFAIMKRFDLLKKLPKKITDKDFEKINSVRLLVAHPSKSLVSNKDPIEQLDEVIRLLNIFKINSIK